jgi:hypothetical protein
VKYRRGSREPGGLLHRDGAAAPAGKEGSLAPERLPARARGRRRRAGMAADQTPLADAGIRHRKHTCFHRPRRAAGASERRLLNGRCEPRRMRERSRSRARVAASRTSTLIWARISSCAKYRQHMCAAWAKPVNTMKVGSPARYSRGGRLEDRAKPKYPQRGRVLGAHLPSTPQTPWASPLPPLMFYMLHLRGFSGIRLARDALFSCLAELTSACCF